jgi:stage II sporulation protein D
MHGFSPVVNYLDTLVPTNPRRPELKHIPPIAGALVFLAAAIPGPRLAAAEDDPPEEPGREVLEERSHASGNRPELGPVILGNPTEAVVAIRVGLHYSFTATGTFSEFASLHHPLVRVSNTAGAVHVVDRATGEHVAVMQPGEVFEVRFDGTAYLVTGPDGVPLTAAGPIAFSPHSPENLFRVESIERANILGNGRVRPLYRGALEVARGASTQAGRVNLVNVLELEDYVPGVVVNESIASFHIEALKAQATAARGYAVANVGRWSALGYPFDLVDSSSSQVYRGYLSEHANAVLASEGTRGLVASYQGRIITAFYSSSFGGHSDSVHWIFNSPTSQLPGTNVTPYLTGIYDGEPPSPDLSDPGAHQAFWSDIQLQTYDSCVRVNNRFSRWRIAVTAASIKARLPSRHVVISGDTTGSVTGVQVQQRMAGSGRIAAARVFLTTGIVEVRGWDNLRRVLGAPTATTPGICPGSPIAAGFVLTNPSLLEAFTNPDGSFGGVIASGGGWGHNVGLSQYGAHGRGRAGQGFVEILKAYYTGVDIGSYPIDIGRVPGSGPPTLRQRFVSPSGSGVLEIRPQGLKGLRVHFNETWDLALKEEDLAEDVVRVDVTPYLVAGENLVQFNPVGRSGQATVLVIVE